jgi:hypothetical protein
MIDHSKIDQYHSLNGIPAMTSPQIHAYLEELGSQWTGQGSAVELGCWLGASAIALLKGLTKAGYNQPFWAFDKWEADRGQVPKAQAQGVKLKLGENTLPIFKRNVNPIYDKVTTVKGGMPSTLHFYDSQPIEICILDAPKAEPIFTESIKAMSPYWIPGVTILGLLDYDFYLRHTGAKREKFKAPVVFMEKHKRNFSLLKEWPDEVVKFFKYEKIF